MKRNRKPDLPVAGWTWVVLCLVILFVVVIRVRLLNLPLERDEGEFAYIGQLMLDGVPPYELAYAVKLPGTAAMYAMSMTLFGQTPAAIHLGLLLANVTAILLVFFLARRWFDERVGVIAAGIYGLMSLSGGVMGSAAHATQFVTPAALAGILILLRGLESGRAITIFVSGLFFGAAFLLKQPGVFFGFYGGLLLLDHELTAGPIRWGRCFRRVLIYCAGVILPFAALCLWIWHAGAFAKFWEWTFRMAEGGWVSLPQGWIDFVFYFKWTRETGQTALWVLAGVILPFVWWMPAVRPVRRQFLLFCAISIFTGAIGLFFNPHYLVVTLPAAGMVIGLGITAAHRVLKGSTIPGISLLPAALLCVDCGWALFSAQDYYFTGSLDEVLVSLYQGNPFRESARVADYIKKNSGSDDRVAVLGSEPEIYFLAHRKSATGHVSTYILVQNRPYSRAMQEEMTREIESARPEYIVYVNNILSWLPDEKADQTLVRAMISYVKENYGLAGMTVTAPGSAAPVYYWDADAAHAPMPPPHSMCIYVYRRQKPAGGH